jgi:hypothetical protein
MKPKGSFKMSIAQVGDKYDVDFEWHGGKDEGPLDADELKFRTLVMLGITKIMLKGKTFESIVDPEEREATKKSFLDRTEALSALIEENNPDDIREQVLERIIELRDDFHRLYPYLKEED